MGRCFEGLVGLVERGFGGLYEMVVGDWVGRVVGHRVVEVGYARESEAEVRLVAGLAARPCSVGDRALPVLMDKALHMLSLPYKYLQLSVLLTANEKLVEEAIERGIMS